MSYWSSGKDSIEVDFIVERGKDSLGIEAKAASRPRKDWFSGLSVLQAEGHVKRSIIVYLGNRRFKHASGVELIPIEDFLSELTKL